MSTPIPWAEKEMPMEGNSSGILYMLKENGKLVKKVMNAKIVKDKTMKMKGE